MHERIAKLIENRYDLGTVTDVYEIYGGYINRSFGAVVDKDGRRNRYVVRKYKEGTSPDEIQFEHALIRHAIANGLTLGADVINSLAGATFVQPGPDNGIFAVYEYLNGEDKYSWDNPDLTDVEYQSAARVLADFHNAVKDFDPGETKRKEPPIPLFWPNLTDRLIRLASRKRGGVFHTCYIEHFNDIEDAIARTRFSPDLLDNLPVIPTHYDYHPGNLKWEREQVVGIFDFDWSKIDLRLFDLCLACIYFCTGWWGETDGELRLEKFSLFLQSYQHRLTELKGLVPLQGEEQRQMPDMLSAAALYLLHWIGDDYLQEPGVNDLQNRGYLIHCIRLLRWLKAHRSEIESNLVSALK